MSSGSDGSGFSPQQITTRPRCNPARGGTEDESLSGEMPLLYKDIV